MLAGQDQHLPLRRLHLPELGMAVRKSKYNNRGNKWSRNRGMRRERNENRKKMDCKQSLLLQTESDTKS